MDTVHSWSDRNQVIFGSVITLPFVWIQMFYADTCVQSIIALAVDLYDHTTRYFALTSGELNRQWTYLLFADINIIFNMHRLKTCWESEHTSLGSNYTDQNNTTIYSEYEWYTPEVIEFVQMDLMNIFRMVEYTDLTLAGVISNDWVDTGITGMQAFMSLIFAVYQNYLSAKTIVEEP